MLFRLEYRAQKWEPVLGEKMLRAKRIMVPSESVFTDALIQQESIGGFPKVQVHF
jgi:hypothetical protein